MFLETSPNIQTRRAPQAALENAMQQALYKYEQNLYKAKQEGQKDIDLLNQNVETGKLESLTEIKARTLKQGYIKTILED